MHLYLRDNSFHSTASFVNGGISGDSNLCFDPVINIGNGIYAVVFMISDLFVNFKLALSGVCFYNSSVSFPSLFLRTV